MSHKNQVQANFSIYLKELIKLLLYDTGDWRAMLVSEKLISPNSACLNWYMLHYGNANLTIYLTYDRYRRKILATTEVYTCLL